MSLKNSILALSNWAYKNNIEVLILIFFASGLLALGLSRLEVNVNNETMFDAQDPALIAYRDFQRQFGRDDIVIAAISSESIFEARFMTKLNALHNELQQSVPWLDDITSLSNVDWIAAENETLKVSDLGKEWPQSGSLPSILREEIITSPLYKNMLISADGKMTLIALRSTAFINQQKLTETSDEDFFADEDPLQQEPIKINDENLEGLSRDQLNQFLTEIKVITNKYQTKDFNIMLTGGPMIDKAHDDAIHSDVLLLILLSIILIIILLAVLLKTWLGVIIPLAVIILSLICTLGLMGWMGIPVTFVSQALPPILLTAGVLDCVHLLSMYYLNRSKGESSSVAINNTFQHAGLAVFYTSLTTAAGFLSFTIARLEPISDFGWLAAFGILLAMLLSLLLVPALLGLFTTKNNRPHNEQRWNQFTKLLLPLANFSLKRKYSVFFAVFLLVLLGIPGITKLTFSHNVLNWFDDSSAIRLNTLAVDEQFEGTVPLEFIIDTEIENGILTPEFMQSLRTFQDFSQELKFPNVKIGRANSIIDVVERIHSQLAPEKKNNLPSSEDLIHQEILLYEGGGAKQISRLTDRSYSLARVTIRLEWTDAKYYVELREILTAKAEQIFSTQAKVNISGTVDLLSIGIVDVIKGMLDSYLLAIGLIAIMLILLLKRIALGLACLIPNFLPIFLLLSAMGYLGIPIDMFSVLLGGIALGIAVDDTVHLTNSIFTELKQTEDSIEQVVQNAVSRIGPAIVVTTAVMALGFSIFGLSSITALSTLGLLLFIVMILALLSDMLIIPALVSLFVGTARKKNEVSLSTEQSAR